MQALGSYSVGLLQQLYRGGSSTLRQWQLGSGVEWSGALAGMFCRTRFGLELQGSVYPEDRLFDGYYGGLLTHWVCPEQQLQVQLRAGVDRPVHGDRPGGDQRQYSLRLSRYFAVGNGYLAAEYDFFKQIDSKGYSPLLENNAARKLTRSVYRLEYRWSSGGLNPYVGIEWLDQAANLPLFSPRNRVLTIGIRHLW